MRSWLYGPLMNHSTSRCYKRWYACRSLAKNKKLLRNKGLLSTGMLEGFKCETGSVVLTASREVRPPYTDHQCSQCHDGTPSNNVCSLSPICWDIYTAWSASDIIAQWEGQPSATAETLQRSCCIATARPLQQHLHCYHGDVSHRKHKLIQQCWKIKLLHFPAQVNFSSSEVN